MPRRTAKPHKLEVEFERKPLTPGQERRLLKIALDRAPKEIEEWRQAQSEEERFYASPQAAIAAFNLGEYGLARELAEQALALSHSFKENWNYGNALHYAHTTMGLLALRSEDLPQAARELAMSGRAPGSPQLRSFGPTMQLAKAMLKVGAAEPVLEYLQQCRAFWTMGGEWIDVWERKVRLGLVPNFFLHSYR